MESLAFRELKKLGMFSIIKKKCRKRNILCTLRSKLHFMATKDKQRNIDRFRFNKENVGASLVVQWLRIHLPMQGTRV